MNALQRDRMTEMYITVQDALNRAMVATYGVVVDQVPRRQPPPYLPAPRGQTALEYEAALGRLSKLGIVRRVS